MPTPMLHVLGIMNGTSLDGVDFVWCRIQRKPPSIKFLDQSHSSFPKSLHRDLLRAARQESRVDELALAHHALGRFYAEEARKLKQKKRWKIDLIGLHGQTVFHQPPQATLQIGESSYLQLALNCPVINDFRVADLATGGEAAPLAPLFHWVAFHDRSRSAPIAVHNLGGISNVTFMPQKCTVDQVTAFDTGPANILIDLCIQEISRGKKRFDKDGDMAAQGLPNPRLVESWLNHKYFMKKPPKSCGREEFGELFFERAQKNFKKYGVHSTEDKLACLTELTARSIANSYHEFLPEVPKEVFLCGGGAHNRYLRFRLGYWLPESKILTVEDLGWPVSAVEGAAFALLAAYRYWQMPGNLPQITGANRAVVLGKM